MIDEAQKTPLLRSAQFPAFLLLVAALVGLVLANTAAFEPVSAILEVHFGLPILDFSVAHWVSDGLLALFFLIAAIELRFEFTRGELRNINRAMQPAIAAVGGVLVPILVFLLIAGGSPAENGWPIPTATDIAFALGVLAVFGKGLPPAVRAFLLALAILDDIIGIIFIAVLFSTGLNWGLFGLGVVAVVLFGFVSRYALGRRAPVLVPLLILLGVLAWALVALSGVHATIAGVLLGLAMSPVAAARASHFLEPWVNALVLPLFALVAAFVVIPQVSPTELSPAFWGIVVALPVGKIVGIGLFGWIALRIRPRGTAPTIVMPDLLAAGALGGIGFTVSLLLANLAFASDAGLRDQAILGVLLGSGIALVLSAVFVSIRARSYRNKARLEQVPA